MIEICLGERRLADGSVLRALSYPTRDMGCGVIPHYALQLTHGAFSSTHSVRDGYGRDDVIHAFNAADSPAQLHSMQSLFIS